jgi:hypothetical protein
MLDKFRTLLTAPVFEDEETSRLAGLFNIILLAIFSIAIVTCIGFVLLSPDQINQLGFMFFILPLILALLFLVRRGYVNWAIKIFTVSLWLMLSLLTNPLLWKKSPKFWRIY